MCQNRFIVMSDPHKESVSYIETRWKCFCRLLDLKELTYNVCPRVARFFLVQTYQNGKIYTKWPQTIPNCHKLYQMAAYVMFQMVINDQKFCQHFPFQGPPKFTQIGTFGLKINHLATLVWPRCKALPRQRWNRIWDESAKTFFWSKNESFLTIVRSSEKNDNAFRKARYTMYVD
jgi:hypothetical protein